MREHTIWFDTKTGGVFEFTDDAEPEQVDPRYRMYGELLMCDTTEFDDLHLNFDQPSAAEFDRERLVTIGEVALKAMIQYGGHDAVMTSTVMRRMSILGVGPTVMSYFKPKEKRFKNMNDYNLAIGSPLGRQKRRFDTWTLGWLRIVAAGIEETVGGRPTFPDYKVEMDANRFPQEATLIRIFGGGINLVNEQLGYIDAAAMDYDDYQEFGRIFWLVNGEEKFLSDSFKILSARFRGPSFERIVHQFGSIAAFKETVRQRMLDRQRKLSRYRHYVLNNVFPRDYADLDDDVLLQRGTRYDLLVHMAPSLRNNRRIIQLITKINQPDKFAEIFAHYCALEGIRHLPGNVELTAKELGLGGYIWPRPTYYRDHILVTNREMSAFRKKDREARRARKQIAQQSNGQPE